MDGCSRQNHLTQFPFTLVMKKYKIIKMKYYLPVCCLYFFSACSSGGNKKPVTDNLTNQMPSYRLAAVENSGVATMIKLPAQLSAYQEVSIFPKVNGYVKRVNVDIGSEVHAGQLLMLLEAPESGEATVQAKEKFEEARAGYSIDRENYARLLEASATAGAVSPLDLSSAHSKMEADSSLANAEKTNWQMQQTLQDYLHVTAPFDGVITERNVFPGALVNAESKDKPMLELKEINRLRLKVDVPESLAGSFKTNDTISFFTTAFPGKRMTGKISRQSMNINTQYRSERMEIDVENKSKILQPGMYADVILYSKGSNNALSVPRSSLVISTEGKYVIAMRNGHTIKINVLTGSETNQRIEIFGPVQAGEKVIEHANDEIHIDNE
jgi:membrane fusion protein (multidrug efflux system)